MKRSASEPGLTKTRLILTHSISRDHEFTFSRDKGCLSAGQVGDGRLKKENVKRKS